MIRDSEHGETFILQFHDHCILGNNIMTYSLKEFQKTDVDKVAKSQAKLLILAKTKVLYKGRNKRGFRYFLGKPKMRNICCNIVSCYRTNI